jgi:hypothetical protein
MVKSADERRYWESTFQSQAGFGPNPIEILALPSLLAIFGIVGFSLFARIDYPYAGMFLGFVIAWYVFQGETIFSDFALPGLLLFLPVVLGSRQHEICFTIALVICAAAPVWTFIERYRSNE